MSSDDQKKAVEDIKGYARAHRISFGIRRSHCRIEMSEAHAGREDVRHALMNLTSATYQPDNDRWKVRGPDLSGLELAVIVVIDDGLIIITVF